MLHKERVDATIVVHHKQPASNVNNKRGVCATFVERGGLVIRFKLAEQIEKKQFRDGRRLTLQEVSQATGINRSTLSKLLNQRGYVTSTEILDRLAGYFGCELHDLAERTTDG